MCSVPIDEHAVRDGRDECDEGGEAPCWAHLLDEGGTLDPTAPETDESPDEDGTETAPSY